MSAPAAVNFKKYINLHKSQDQKSYPFKLSTKGTIGLIYSHPPRFKGQILWLKVEKNSAPLLPKAEYHCYRKLCTIVTESCAPLLPKKAYSSWLRKSVQWQLPMNTPQLHAKFQKALIQHFKAAVLQISLLLPYL